MEGRSFVETVRAIEVTVDSVLAEPTATRESVLSSGLAVMRTLSDLCELTRDSQPIPGPTAAETIDEGELDDSVVSVLEVIHSGGTPSPADVINHERAQSRGRLESASELVTVPLGKSGPAAQNWPVVFAFVHDQLDVLKHKCGRIRDRITRSPKAGSVFERVWQSVVDTMTDLTTVFRHTLSRHQWITYRADRPDDQPGSFGSWVVETLDT